MNLTIQLPDADVPTLKAKATALGVSTEQYALQVLERDLAPDWLASTNYPWMRSTPRSRRRGKPGA